MKHNFYKNKAFLQIREYINDENINYIYNKNRVFKFGTQISNNPHLDYKLDKVNNDKGWEDAMINEVKSINKHQTFITLEEDKLLPEGYQKIPYHYVFDAKFDDRKKGRLVISNKMSYIFLSGIKFGVKHIMIWYLLISFWQ